MPCWTTTERGGAAQRRALSTRRPDASIRWAAPCRPFGPRTCARGPWLSQMGHSVAFPDEETEKCPGQLLPIAACPRSSRNDDPFVVLWPSRDLLLGFAVVGTD